MLLWLLLPLPRPLRGQLHLLKAALLSTQVHRVFTSGPHYFCCLLPALPDPSLGALGCSMADRLAMTRSSTEPFLAGSCYVHGQRQRPGLCPKAPNFSVQHFKIMIFKAQSVLSKTGSLQ